jgi:hypothetical protein
LEEEFRAELEEKQHIIAALNTKVGFRESRTQRELQHLEEELRAELEEEQQQQLGSRGQSTRKKHHYFGLQGPQIFLSI